MFENIKEIFTTSRFQIPIQLIDVDVYSVISSHNINPQRSEFFGDRFLYESDPKPIDRRIIPGYMLDRFRLSNYRYFPDTFYLKCMQYMDNTRIVMPGPNGEYSSIQLFFDLFGKIYSLNYDTRRSGNNSTITANLKLGHNNHEYPLKQRPVSLDEVRALSSILTLI